MADIQNENPEDVKNEVIKGKDPSSVELIFPLQTEITFDFADLLSYISKLDTLFEVYKNRLEIEDKQFVNYDLKSEIFGLKSFLANLERAIQTKITTDPGSFLTQNREKTSIFDYEVVTLKIINGTQGPQISPFTIEKRQFSDGTTRDVVIYNKIDNIYFTKKNTSESLAVIKPIKTTDYAINPSTLSLIFNIKQIIEKQLDSSAGGLFDVLRCAGEETVLTKLERNFAWFTGLFFQPKVLVQDFVNAYISPPAQIVSVPQTAIDDCKKINSLRVKIGFYELTWDGSNKQTPEHKQYIKNKEQLLELTKKCPEATRNQIDFDGLKDLEKKLGPLFSSFLERFKLACIVNEALKCVMPQLSCEEILRDLTPDNFEQRLQLAFPNQKLIIGAIVENFKDNIEKENLDRQNRGDPPLSGEEQSKKVIETINKFIDLEVLCKIDPIAIYKAIESILKGFKLPEFNFLDWQFNLNVDINAAIIEALLQALIDLIFKILNELIGCGALDGLVAGLINSDFKVQNLLHNDLQNLFGGNFNWENSSLKDTLDNFLSQSSNDLNKLIAFEIKTGPTDLLLSYSGNLGLSPSTGISVLSTASVDVFGGLISADIPLTNQNNGLDLATVVEFDVTKLASSEGQLEFLKEIGKYQLSTTKENTGLSRISDDSIVQISNNTTTNDSNDNLIGGSTAGQALQAEQSNSPENTFRIYGIREKNRHILRSLTVLNERENVTSLITTQQNLVENIKDYVKTCFALLSPTETIELISGDCSREVKLTITGIAQVRYPLLFSILRYPERHAALFATFGKITRLGDIATKMQMLASEPVFQKMMVDPKVCAPFTDIYDFRKSLMSQVLPSDLANEVMDNLIEDDRKRANDLINSLANLANNPAGSAAVAVDKIRKNADFPNRKPDGSLVEEVDVVIDSAIETVLDHIKIKFDEDLDSFPAATSALVEKKTQIFEFSQQQPSPIPGLLTPSTEPAIIANKEFLEILASSGSTPLTEPEFKISSSATGEITNRYFNKTIHKNKTGELLNKIFIDLNLDYNFDVRQENNNIKTIHETNAESSLKQNDELQSFRDSEFELQSPKWNINYKEFDNGKFKFVIKTSGDVKTTTPPAINFYEKINFSGNILQTDSKLIELIKDIGLSTTRNEICNFDIIPTRLSVFQQIFKFNLIKVNDYLSALSTLPQNFGGLIEIYKNESNYILETLSEELQTSSITDFTNSELLKEVQIYQQQNSDTKTVKLNLIDFSPIQTQEQKICGIDTHLLQLDAVKKRIKQHFICTPREDSVNIDSRINTKYTDNKPGSLSVHIMTGLVDTFIRTCVIHNIFKGLFVFEKFKYNLSSFSYQYLIYLFIENRVKKDIKIFGLEEDFNNEYNKICNWLIKEDLINEQESGSSLYKIVKYHVNSVLQFLNKLLQPSENILSRIQNNISNNFISTINNNSPTDINVGYNYVDLLSFNNRTFFDSLSIRDTYTISQGQEFELRRNLDLVYSSIKFDIYSRKNDFGFTSNTNFGYIESPNSESLVANLDQNVQLVLQKYVRMNFKDYIPYSNNTRGGALLNALKDEIYLNGVVSLKTFKELNILLAGHPNLIGSEFDNLVLYTEDEDRKHLNLLKEKPKFGLRLVLKVNTEFNENDNELKDNFDRGFLNNFIFLRQHPTVANLRFNNTTTRLNYNKENKLGNFLSMKFDENMTNEFKKVEILSRVNLIPLIEKEIEVNYIDDYKKYISDSIADGYVEGGLGDLVFYDSNTRENYLKDKVKLFDNLTGDNFIDVFYRRIYENVNQNTPLSELSPIEYYIEQVYNETYFKQLKNKFIEDPKFTLLVNYCLQDKVANTLALFNSFIGMNNESMYKLFDGTKNTIKHNFVLHKNSGNFKTRQQSLYQKNKNSKINGPSPLELMKAAIRIPVGTLKGLSNAVDPNIFLADKIVMAGKAGFVQPKYKRFEDREEIPQIGSEETYITSEGIASDKIYKLDDGQWKALPEEQISSGGNPLIDYVPVAIVKQEGEKYILDKDENEKVKVRYGPSFNGIPWDPKTDKAIDENFDEQNIETFDIRTSVPIFPGEKINIPYKVASLALAPFPIFTPGLTTYNLAMPFGPIFLTLEDLLVENPQFKFSEASRKDRENNLSCKDTEANNEDDNE